MAPYRVPNVGDIVYRVFLNPRHTTVILGTEMDM